MFGNGQYYLVGQTWAVTDETGANYTAADVPIIYTDAAFSFLALYNTSYALNMSVYVENTLPLPSVGYYDGVQEDGGMLWSITNNENGMILSAARYAIENNP